MPQEKNFFIGLIRRIAASLEVRSKFACHRARHRISKLLQPHVGQFSLEQLQRIRLHELDLVTTKIPPRSKILEIGAGAGWQAQQLSALGHDVVAIEIAEDKEGAHKDYKEHQVFPVTGYDGSKIPTTGDDFDVVFSSNVLEHIPHVREFQKEILRVLRDDGIAIHVLPTLWWRLLTTATEIISRLAFNPNDRIWQPLRHGDRGTFITEHYLFTAFAWKRLFRKTGWTVEKVASNRLTYSGKLISKDNLSFATRGLLSHFIGPACYIYILKKQRVAP